MSEKPQLPFGWVVKQSKSYPDRVYYFNINSGASTWEFPDLIKSYNVNSAGPVSPPILSATSFNPGSAQSPTKFPPEPTFSPQLSDSDNDGSLSGKSPALQNKQIFGRANHQVPFTPNQRTGSGFGPPQTPNYPQYGATRFKGHPNEKPGLLGPYPHVTSPKLHDRANQGCGTPIHGTSKLVTSPVHQQFVSEQKKALLKTPAHLSSTPVSYSNAERPKALSAKSLDNSLNASTSQSFSNKCVNKPSETVRTNAASKDKAFCSGQNAYNKAIKILSKSVEKTVNQLGKLVNIQGSKSDTPTNPGSGGTQKNSLILSGNQRKPAEKDINDNIKSSGKKRQLDQDLNFSEKGVKKKRLDKSIEVVVQSKVPSPNKGNKQSASPKKVETKGAKRKSSEVFHRDSKVFDLNDSSDRRKVVKNSVTDTATSRSVVIKNTPVKFGTDSSTISEDLKVQASVNMSQNVPGSCRSFTRQVSEDSNLSLELPDDPDQSGILRQFIGDKDKLLSIQSWIDNLRDGAGSSTASVDSFGESVSGDADDKRVVISDKSTDSGYLSPPLQMGSKTERGWPGEAKKCDISSREITAMEIDDIPLPETDVKFQEEDMVIDLMLSEVREQMKSDPEKVCGTLTATVAELQEFLKEQDNQGKLISSKAVVEQTGEISSAAKQLYIVIDTNVIISDLSFIQDLKDMEITGFGKPVLYIPWIVLQELDSLKQACTKGMPKLTASTQNKASRGIKMLQQMFRIKHPQIKGQTPMESQEAARVFRADCNDDIILMTCLHYRQNCAGAEVVLLTNDNNLINKALVCGVNAYNRRDLLSGLEKIKQIAVPSQSNINIPRPAVTPKKFIPITGPAQSTPAIVKQYGPGQVPFKPIPGPSTSAGPGCIAQSMLEEERSYTVEKLAGDIHCKLKGLLKAGFGKVLQTEMELAYSDMWKEIVYRKPPWTLNDILDSMKKHWIAVFGLVFQRALVKQVDYLIKNFKEEKGKPRVLTMRKIKEIEKDGSMAYNIKNEIYSVEDLAVCCREAVVFLDQCVRRNVYGSAIRDIKESVQHLQHLCDSICKGETNVKSISSLETYLEQQPSSQQQSLCDNKGKNLHLVKRQCHDHKTNLAINNTTSVSPHSGIWNSNSTQPQSGGRSHNSPVPSSSVKDGNQPVQAPVSWELAASKLQKIWHHIYSCCDEMRKMLSPGMGEEVLSRIERTLSLLVPAAKEIRTEYVVVLQIPLSQLPGHMDKIGRLTNQCNNYFSSLQLNDEEPVADAECFLALFRNGQQRESLNMFLKQLDEMLCHLYKCLHHLDPGD